MDMAARDIIVVGASAGGFDAVQTLTGNLPPDLPAAVFITNHISPHSDEFLLHVIRRSAQLNAFHAQDGESIEHGRIYIAPPDQHLIISSGYVELSHGPKENMQRPCINTMFRSAAASYGERVTGVLLTGLLDDGAAGLWEIQQKNGATVVQDPDEAVYRSMPENAIRGLNVQYIVRLAEIAPLLTRLAQPGQDYAPTMKSEQAEIHNSNQTCPECGGAMRVAQMGRLREFRCHIGHRMGLRTIIDEKATNIDRFIQAAQAQCEELRELLGFALDDAGPGEVEALTREFRQKENILEQLRAISENRERETIP